MTLRIVFGPAVAFALCGAALAQSASPPPGSEYDRCIASADQRGSALAKCEQAAYRREDKALNDAYQQLAAKVDVEAKAPLDRAQRAWLDYRDSECAYEASHPGGAAPAPVVEARCMKRLTEQRAKDLR